MRKPSDTVNSQRKTRAQENEQDVPQLSLLGRLVAPPCPPSEPLAVPTVPPPIPVLAVCELVRAARQSLEMRFGDVRVEGEISGLKRSANGHLYFTLKDNEAQIDCVMYARDTSRLRFRLADGLQIRCRGKLTIYEGRGRFQLQVQSIDPAGLGALALAFEALKQKLAGEGLFDPLRKRPLPFLPRRIGVVTSAQGAVIRDIIRVAHRRFPVSILLSPSKVQGEGTASALIAALKALCQVESVDLIILARGGGSLEDLWAFNDEALARAIAACPIPVISAVGHETDFTIADFVADKRAPTPSAAAEIAVPILADLRDELRTLEGRLSRALLSEVRHRRLVLERMIARISTPKRLLDDRYLALDDYVHRAQTALQSVLRRQYQGLQSLENRFYRAHPKRRIADQRAHLMGLANRMTHLGFQLINQRRNEVNALESKLTALSPLAVLERGYCLTRDENGHILSSHQGLENGDRVTITLRTGDLEATIDKIIPTS